MTTTAPPAASTVTAPVETAPTTIAPTDTVPTDTVPTDTAPTDTVPTDTVPTDTVPTTNTEPEAHNRFAGQGAVLLDIGGTVGALVVTMPAELEGQEVEIRPVGAPHAEATDHSHASGPIQSHEYSAPHQHTESHQHSRSHQHTEPLDHGHGHLLHVAVVARQAETQVVHSLVFGELEQGAYELYLRPHGPVELVVDVRGGEVTTASWPQ